ncbi:hypothetical protein LEY_50 [Paenibacillus phage Ley]|uniref:Uncharacterized protein n=4 Tax=Halcyonevirus TaxID=2843388 RepID=A0A345ASK7_9CAUD|nr:hypothetical protein TRIPP_58 [Paenibacillus phage Tripp]YP_010082217.1 hypothetical protein KMD17_gp50 [Paenibacillus phage C7Cdelta]AXF39977.1 hypothetical protein ASH_50 [Paenibacillus phage Ash]AXF40264.1 hypothetical protein LEY_50 [Paenibacillus phage Ley]ALH46431.1 hypothetical protein TRIPP_58 [Paenibacillus phage Tripp]AXF39811.1 hypothetical protein C7CDELTA_50 [Paenibacillus phage C7Cdelta]
MKLCVLAFVFTFLMLSLFFGFFLAISFGIWKIAAIAVVAVVAVIAHKAEKL